MRFEMLLYLIVVIAAWVGVDFSPSYAATFCFLFILLDLVSEIILLWPKGEGRGRLLRAIGSALPGVGSILLLIGSFTYAVGDDPIRRNVLLTLVFTAIAYIALRFSLVKAAGWGLLSKLTLIFALLVGIFSFLSGFTCPALLPVGIGVLLVIAAWLVRDLRQPKTAYHLLLSSGYVLLAAFLLAPMLF